MDTNFEHYKVFYYVAKYGNLTKAAAVLKPVSLRLQERSTTLKTSWAADYSYAAKAE